MTCLQPLQLSLEASTKIFPIISQGNIKTEDIQRVNETLKETFISSTLECLNQHVWQLHTDTQEKLQAALDRISRLYKQIFLKSTLLNPSLQTYELYKPIFEKANQLYDAYKKECIEEALSKMPIFLYETHQIDKKDLPILQIIISQVTQVFKTSILEPEFDKLHQLCTLRTIHYALGIPATDSQSKIIFVLKLGFSKLKE